MDLNKRLRDLILKSGYKEEDFVDKPTTPIETVWDLEDYSLFKKDLRMEEEIFRFNTICYTCKNCLKVKVGGNLRERYVTTNPDFIESLLGVKQEKILLNVWKQYTIKAFCTIECNEVCAKECSKYIKE
jgi:hypothetical protein